MTSIAPFTRDAARKLRRDMTAQERRLWWHLRDLNRRLGTHFRRQAPVGRFIADLADLRRRLVIEVDGGQHGGEDDAARDRWLESQGFRVLRFWNQEVNANIEGVMQVVLDAVEAPHPPQPSPTWGEGGADSEWLREAEGVITSPPPRGEGLGVGGARNERTNP